MHQKPTECHENIPSPQKPHMQQQNNITRSNKKETYTYGTIIGHSPHPPICVWVGWVFCLGLCRSNGVFLITVIVSFIFCVIYCLLLPHWDVLDTLLYELSQILRCSPGIFSVT